MTGSDRMSALDIQRVECSVSLMCISAGKRPPDTGLGHMTHTGDVSDAVD